LQRDLNCAPCYSPQCRILTHACMREIMPEEVTQKVEELMARFSKDHQEESFSPKESIETRAQNL